MMVTSKELFMRFVDAVGTLAQTAASERAELDAAKQDTADAIAQSKLADTLTDEESDRVDATLDLIGSVFEVAGLRCDQRAGATGPAGEPGVLTPINPLGEAGASGAESTGEAADGSPGTDTGNTASIVGREQTVVDAHEEQALDTEATRGTSG